MELRSYHQQEEFGKGQKEGGDASPYVLPASQNSSRWNPLWLNNTCTPLGRTLSVRMIGQKQPEN